jgi:hypothetical protein
MHWLVTIKHLYKLSIRTNLIILFFWLLWRIVNFWVWSTVFLFHFVLIYECYFSSIAFLAVLLTIFLQCVLHKTSKFSTFEVTLMFQFDVLCQRCLSSVALPTVLQWTFTISNNFVGISSMSFMFLFHWLFFNGLLLLKLSMQSRIFLLQFSFFSIDVLNRGFDELVFFDEFQILLIFDAQFTLSGEVCLLWSWGGRWKMCGWVWNGNYGFEAFAVSFVGPIQHFKIYAIIKFYFYWKVS